jgi:flagellar hook protein FlgE
MISSIYIAMSGLRGYEQGLRTISNNTANLNTPGFKGSSIEFADMFSANGGGINGSSTNGQYGLGLNTLGTSINFSQGQLQNTGNNLDLAVDGQGLFTLRAADGSVRYTRDGHFKFNAEGTLISSTSGESVLAQDNTGSLSPISIANLNGNAAKASTSVLFSGNLSSAATTHTVGGVVVIDAAGTSYTLSARLDAIVGTPGSWSVTLLNGADVVGTGTIGFINGRPDPANSHVALTFNPPGQGPVPLSLDFSNNVTSSGAGTTSTLSMASQDGYGPGGLTKVSFDDAGVLQLLYSNGQTVKGPRLALGRFNSQDAISSVGNNEFEVKDGRAWESGVAGELGFGSVRSGMIEISNVDLSQQFSDLVIMQRGYQACSQIVSTANDMLTELFSMKK